MDRVVDAATNVFHPGWVGLGIAIGLLVQVGAWVTGIGLLGGLTGYVVMGIIVGVASPGRTVVEPAVAAFIMASLGFLIDHWLLAIIGVGLPIAILYGIAGLLLGAAGGWIGETVT
ncbi:MAG: hypothetical protein ABEI31_05485 [Halodesulfurarchaeum sp.]